MPKILSAHILTLPMKCSEPEKPMALKLPPQNPQSVKKSKTKYPLFIPVGPNQQQLPRSYRDQEGKDYVNQL
uniref:Uncharacterized protein n=1 Tax=Romanomermis culicivorax TaxID=13658 RepID=A0A915JTT2_ROMCU